MTDPNDSPTVSPEPKTHAKSKSGGFTVPVPSKLSQTAPTVNLSPPTAQTWKPRHIDPRLAIVRDIEENWGPLALQKYIPERRRPRVRYTDRFQDCKAGKPPENDSTKWPLLMLRALKNLSEQYKMKTAMTVSEAIEEAVTYKISEYFKAPRCLERIDINRICRAFDMGATVGELMAIEKDAKPPGVRPNEVKKGNNTKVNSQETAKVTKSTPALNIKTGAALPDADAPPPYRSRSPSPSITTTVPQSKAKGAPVLSTKPADDHDTDFAEDLKTLRLRLKAVEERRKAHVAAAEAAELKLKIKSMKQNQK